MHILNAMHCKCKGQDPIPKTKKKIKYARKTIVDFIPQSVNWIKLKRTHVLRSSVQLSGVPRSPIAAKVAPRLGAALMLHALVVSSEQLLAWLHVLVRVRGLGLGLEVGLRSAEVSGKGQG